MRRILFALVLTTAPAAGAIPRSPPLRAFWGDSEAAILRAATADDDYQIAFTADPARETAIMAAAEQTGTAVTRIGTVGAGEGVALLREGHIMALPQSGSRHF